MVKIKNPLVRVDGIYYNRSIGTKVLIHDKMQYNVIQGEYNVSIIR